MSYLTEDIIEGTWYAQACHFLSVFSALLLTRRDGSVCSLPRGKEPAFVRETYGCPALPRSPCIILTQWWYISKPTWPHIESHAVQLASLGNKDDFLNLRFYKSYIYISPAPKLWGEKRGVIDWPLKLQHSISAFFQSHEAIRTCPKIHF